MHVKEVKDRLENTSKKAVSKKLALDNTLPEIIVTLESRKATIQIKEENKYEVNLSKEGEKIEYTNEITEIGRIK